MKCKDCTKADCFRRRTDEAEECYYDEPIKASDCSCIECGEPSVAFWPVCDPDIPSYPYCRKCLDKVKQELIIQLLEIDKKYNKK